MGPEIEYPHVGAVPVVDPEALAEAQPAEKALGVTPKVSAPVPASEVLLKAQDEVDELRARLATPGGRPSIIRSTSSRLSRTATLAERFLGLVGIGHGHHDLARRAAGGRRRRVGALDVDLGRRQPRGDGSQGARPILEREQQGRLFPAPDLGAGQRLLGPRGIADHQPDLAASRRLASAECGDVDSGVGQRSGHLGQDAGLWIERPL